jgi:DNA invertase Pin-like site-specific DNA recombinase
MTIDKEFAVQISSRKSMSERGWTDILSELRKGDVLVVSELSRVARSISETATIFDALRKKSVTVHVIRENLILSAESSLNSELIVTTLSMCAAVERQMCSERTKAGLQSAKAQGKRLGNPNIRSLGRTISKKANDYAESMRNMLESFCKAGLTQYQIVNELKTHGIKTRRGCDWSQAGLRRLLSRLELKTEKAWS